MAITGHSHVAIGASDMDKSIVFYRDVLGLKLTLDTEEKGGGPYPFHRRAAYFRWDGASPDGFIVLDHHLDRAPFGNAAEVYQIGVHHFALNTSDLQAIVD